MRKYENEFFGKNIYNSLMIRWVVIPAIGGITISIFSCWSCLMEQRFLDFALDALISSIFWSVLSNGNSIIIDFLDKRWSWIEFPVKRFLINLAFLLIYTVAASLMVVYAYVKVIYNIGLIEVIENQGLYSIIKVPLGITLFISMVMHGRAFLLEWRKEAINVERLKNENLSAKFESLKNQVNPHFLFNSLNALTSLVHADPDKAVLFIQKLSDVYRYVLDHQYDELVDLKTELELVKAFTFLNKIRFGDNLNVDLSAFSEYPNKYQVPPLTVQMLVENCFKHNEISKENPLNVSFQIKEDYLSVVNNINPLASPKNDSVHVGLKNIQARYEYLSQKKVRIENDGHQFCIQVPLLKVQLS